LRISGAVVEIKAKHYLTCFEFKTLGSPYNGSFRANWWGFGEIWLKYAIYSFYWLSLGKYTVLVMI